MIYASITVPISKMIACSRAAMSDIYAYAVRVRQKPRGDERCAGRGVPRFGYSWVASTDDNLAAKLSKMVKTFFPLEFQLRCTIVRLRSALMLKDVAYLADPIPHRQDVGLD